MENSQIDLERKVENSFAAQFKKVAELSKLRFRRNSEDSPKVNGDMVIAAKRGNGNPPFSGIFDLEVTITLQLKHRKGVDTLPAFLRQCASLEQAITGKTSKALSAQLSLNVPSFHCYEMQVTGKDDAPDGEGAKHTCIWVISVVAMSQAYATTAAIQQKENP